MVGRMECGGTVKVTWLTTFLQAKWWRFFLRRLGMVSVRLHSRAKNMCRMAVVSKVEE